MKRGSEDFLRARLAELRDGRAGIRYCVVGAGHGGLAMAGHLGIMGYQVSLYNRTDGNLDGARWHGGVSVSGEVEGFGPISSVTSDISEAIRDADVVMVVTPSTAHRGLASLMAPCVRDGQMIVLNPGRTGGALEFQKVFDDAGVEAAVLIAETQTFIYTSRALSRDKARIFKIKNSVPFATLPAYWIPDALGVLNRTFPQFVAGTSVLATSLENIGAVFHPALALMNAGWIEATHGDFEYYLQGITPTVAKMLERIDAERIAVARALGVRSVSAREWLYLSYHSTGADLYQAISNTEPYRGIKAPQDLKHRYIFEDVPMSLVPIASIGEMLNVSTPVIDMVIDLGSLFHDVDYRAAGRTVESLGLAGLSVKQISQKVVGVGRRTRSTR